MNKLMTAFLMLMLGLTIQSCERQANNAKEPVRLPEDTLDPQEFLKGTDPAATKQQLELWLSLYPEEINRIFPEQATSAFGLVAKQYFENQQSAEWLDILDILLVHGADPNVFFPIQEQRRGIMHLAAERNDQAIIKHLIEKLGTAEPALRLTCDVNLVAQSAVQQNKAQNQRIRLNLAEEKNGMTPLHYAVLQKQADPAFIEYLLLQGANPDAEEASLKLRSPYQLATTQPALAAIFERYSGAQLRYEARLNSLINEQLEAAPADRKTILDLAVAYQEMVKNEGFEAVQDINRVVKLCKTNEELNLLAYSLLELFPNIKIATSAKTRNTSIQSWFTTYGAKICSTNEIKIKDSSDSGLRSTTIKELFKETIIKHSQSSNAAIKTQNKNLWCQIVRPQAKSEGCWVAAQDENLDVSLSCSP